jgi:NAD(P)-dependent dehydrogenase (short-subunit alcohol dehydrogenase family)
LPGTFDRLHHGVTLAGRTALITGASLGFGAEIASQFAAAGAALVLCARNGEELEAQRRRILARHRDVQVLAMSADISDTGDVDRLFAEAVRAFGRLDILVANAAVHGPMGSIDQIDWASWVQAISINLIGTVYCARKAVELFRPNRYGKILIVSGGGATSPLPGISAYAASKAGVVRFAETLALEVKGFGIDVNAIAPGAMSTRLTDQMLDAGPDLVGEVLHQRMRQVKSEGGTPPRLGAELCLYLVSSEGDGVTGRLIAAPWDPWPFAPAVKEELLGSDIYTLRRIVPEDRGKAWDND